jgi:NAD+ kinase
MKAIALSFNPNRVEVLPTVRTIVDLARAAGVAVTFADEVPGFEPSAGVFIDEAELIVTVGGDGTLLRAVRIAVPLDVPVLGVNMGRLGFLTEVDTTPDGFARIARALRGEFVVEERVTLEVSVNGVGAHFALNDVVVRRGAQARMAPFGLSLDGELIADVPSDGLVVATPTGSTAYFLSAGGPIIAPSVDAFGVASLLPHTLFARPLIVPTTSTIEITCDSETVHANLETDGTLVQDLSSGDRVTIVRGPRPARFARTGDHAFFARLEDKLQWGVPIKRT